MTTTASTREACLNALGQNGLQRPDAAQREMKPETRRRRRLVMMIRIIRMITMIIINSDHKNKD